MQRRRGQHEAERIQPRRNAFRQGFGVSRAQENDRGGSVAQERSLRSADAAIVANDGEIARHERKWLRVAMFLSAQRLHRGAIPRVAGKLIPAKPLDREDRAAVQQRTGGVEDVGMHGRRRGGVQLLENELRPAGGTGDRLSMKATVRRVTVFLRAVLAKGEGRHRRLGAIIGNACHDAQTRSAMRAIGEGIAIAPSRRIVYLGRAGRAHSRVRRHLRVCLARHAFRDAELSGQIALKRAAIDPINATERRLIAFEAREERQQVARRAPGEDQHALRVVAYLSDETAFPREAPNIGSETHPLHATAHPNLECNSALRRP